MTAPKPHILPEPRGLSRMGAAHYVGVGATIFDEMVSDGRMPKPKKVGSRAIWDRYALDVAFENLPDQNKANPWDGANHGNQNEVSKAG